jgi:hypothetical protein
MPAERKPASKETKATKPKTPTMPKVGPKTVERFDRLAETFVARGATRSQMFGMPVLKAGDKVFAGTFGDAMTFRPRGRRPRAGARAGRRRVLRAHEGSPDEGVGAGPALAREAVARPGGTSLCVRLVIPVDLSFARGRAWRPRLSLHAA